MSTAMYSGVSGLKSQQTKLDVIGNNIANINTSGYKSQRVSFSDVLSQTMSSASAPSSASNRGGTNPMQIGLGVTVGAIDTNMSTGSTESTGNSLDVSIGGDGFFIVKGGSSSDYQFTRAGNFGVDSTGNLTVNGLKVCGWEEYTANTDGTYTYNTQKSVEPINLFSDSYNGNKKVIAPKATSTATLTGNLDPTATANGTAISTIGTVPSTADSTTTMTVYDTEGNSYDVKVNLYKCYTDTDSSSSTYGDTSWYWQVDSSSSNLSVASPSSGYLLFDSNGKLVTGNSSFSATPSVTLTPGSTVGSGAFTVNLDLSGISTYTSSSTSSVTATNNGYKAGSLQGISIGSDGVITGTYDNGQKQPLAKLSLANFTNPSGLEKIGENLYTTSTNSGNFTGGVEVGTNGTGTISSGTLEGSNVDLAAEFSDMMITQRAYQANSKIITTSDQMMETLISMVRN